MQRFDFFVRRDGSHERVTVAAKDSYSALQALESFLEETGGWEHWSFTAPEPARPDQNHWFVLGKSFQLLKEVERGIAAEWRDH